MNEEPYGEIHRSRYGAGARSAHPHSLVTLSQYLHNSPTCKPAQAQPFGLLSRLHDELNHWPLVTELNLQLLSILKRLGRERGVRAESSNPLIRHLAPPSNQPQNLGYLRVVQ